MPKEDEIIAEVSARVPAVSREEWADLLRPVVGLTTNDRAEASVVGQLGGDPSLPDEMWWPEWEGVGPLTFGVALDCAALAGFDTGLSLPTGGTLLFFCYDRQVDPELFVSLDFPSTQAGARVVHVPAGTPVRPRATPAPLRAYPARPLHAQPRRLALPPYDHPMWRPVLAQVAEPDRSAVWQAVIDAEARLSDGDVPHQMGGYPRTVQGDITVQVVATKLGRLSADSPMWSMEARRWEMLLQIDSGGSEDLPWGDLGLAYWLIRHEDLAAGALDEAVMTWSYS